MKSLTAIAALIGVAVAASSSNAFAQSGVPGTPHTKPNKVATPPPPPPPRGPDKLTTQPPGAPGTGPQGTYINFWPPPGPKLVDDLAGPRQPPRPPSPGVGDLAAKPKVRKAPLFPPCNNSDCNIESYKTDCTAAHGGLSSEPGGGIVCNAGPQHNPN